MIARADSSRSSLVLIHSHGETHRPRPSKDDHDNAERFLLAASRILSGRPTGSLVLGEGAAFGEFWSDGGVDVELSRLDIVGVPLRRWCPEVVGLGFERGRMDRQNRALGLRSDETLRESCVAVLGCSGGGSHVVQQLGFSGFGTVIPVDGQVVDETNRGRLIGSEIHDVGLSHKVTVMARMLRAIDPNIKVLPIAYDFPHPRAIAALKQADVIVSCVDTWTAREQINAFSRRYLIPIVDVGIQIETREDVLMSANGQVVAVTPDSSCLRCSLVSDPRLAKERLQNPPGYDLNPDTGDPQIVSMNGTLASEAVSTVLDLVTGYSRGRRIPGWAQYDGVKGQLDVCPLPPHRPHCPGCSEAALGDF